MTGIPYEPFFRAAPRGMADRLFRAIEAINPQTKTQTPAEWLDWLVKNNKINQEEANKTLREPLEKLLASGQLRPDEQLSPQHLRKLAESNAMVFGEHRTGPVPHLEQLSSIRQRLYDQSQKFETILTEKSMRLGDQLALRIGNSPIEPNRLGEGPLREGGEIIPTTSIANITNDAYDIGSNTRMALRNLAFEHEEFALGGVEMTPKEWRTKVREVVGASLSYAWEHPEYTKLVDEITDEVLPEVQSMYKAMQGRRAVRKAQTRAHEAIVNLISRQAPEEVPQFNDYMEVPVKADGTYGQLSNYHEDAVLFPTTEDLRLGGISGSKSNPSFPFLDWKSGQQGATGPDIGRTNHFSTGPGNHLFWSAVGNLNTATGERVRMIYEMQSDWLRHLQSMGYKETGRLDVMPAEDVTKVYVEHQWRNQPPRQFNTRSEESSVKAWYELNVKQNPRFVTEASGTELIFDADANEWAVVDLATGIPEATAAASPQEAIRNFLEQFDSAVEQMAKELEKQTGQSINLPGPQIPWAPGAKNMQWAGAELRRQLYKAAQNGDAGVMIPTGRTARYRWGLSTDDHEVSKSVHGLLYDKTLPKEAQKLQQYVDILPYKQRVMFPYHHRTYDGEYLYLKFKPGTVSALTKGGSSSPSALHFLGPAAALLGAGAASALLPGEASAQDSPTLKGKYDFDGERAKRGMKLLDGLTSPQDIAALEDESKLDVLNALKATQFSIDNEIAQVKGRKGKIGEFTEMREAFGGPALSPPLPRPRTADEVAAEHEAKLPKWWRNSELRSSMEMLEEPAIGGAIVRKGRELLLAQLERGIATLGAINMIPAKLIPGNDPFDRYLADAANAIESLKLINEDLDVATKRGALGTMGAEFADFAVEMAFISTALKTIGLETLVAHQKVSVLNAPTQGWGSFALGRTVLRAERGAKFGLGYGAMHGPLFENKPIDPGEVLHEAAVFGAIEAALPAMLWEGPIATKNAIWDRVVTPMNLRWMSRATGGSLNAPEVKAELLTKLGGLLKEVEMRVAAEQQATIAALEAEPSSVVGQLAARHNESIGEALLRRADIKAKRLEALARGRETQARIRLRAAEREAVVIEREANRAAIRQAAMDMQREVYPNKASQRSAAINASIDAMRADAKRMTNVWERLNTAEREAKLRAIELSTKAAKERTLETAVPTGAPSDNEIFIAHGVAQARQITSAIYDAALASRNGQLDPKAYAAMKQTLEAKLAEPLGILERLGRITRLTGDFGTEGTVQDALPGQMVWTHRATVISPSGRAYSAPFHEDARALMFAHEKLDAGQEAIGGFIHRKSGHFWKSDYPSGAIVDLPGGRYNEFVEGQVDFLQEMRANRPNSRPWESKIFPQGLTDMAVGYKYTEPQLQTIVASFDAANMKAPWQLRAALAIRQLSKAESQARVAALKAMVDRAASDGFTQRNLGMIAATGGGAISADLDTDDQKSWTSNLWLGVAVAAGVASLSHPAVFAAARRAAGLSLDGSFKLPKALEASSKVFDNLIDFGFGKDIPHLPATFGWFDRLTQWAAQSYRPIEVLGSRVEDVLRPSENPKYLLSLVKGADATIQSFYYKGAIDVITREINGPSMKSVFHPFTPGETVEFLKYIVAKRAVGRGLESFGGVEDRMIAAMELVEFFDAQPAFRDAAQRLSHYLDNIGQYAVDSGLWTYEQWAAMKEADVFYVPFKRMLADLELMASGRTTGGGAGSRLYNVAAGVLPFKGSARKLYNPAQAIAQYTSAIIQRSDRYRMGAALFDLADALGKDGDLFLKRIDATEGSKITSGGSARIRLRELSKVAKDGYGINPDAVEALESIYGDGMELYETGTLLPIIWRNDNAGGREYAVVTSRELWQALNSMPSIDAGGLRLFLDATLGQLKRVFTAATTALSPRFFGAINPVRDVFTGIGQSTQGMLPHDIATGYGRAIAGEAWFGKWQKELLELRASGLGGVSLYDQPVSAREAAKRIAPTSNLGLGYQKAKSLMWWTVVPRNLLEKFGQASDLGPRLAEVEAAIRSKSHLVEEGRWTPADLRLYAATQGRRATLDFSNRPGNPVLRLMADYIAFFAPAMQAPFRLAQAAQEKPVRALGVLIGGTAMASTIAWAMKHRKIPGFGKDEIAREIDDRPAWERASYFLLPFGNVLVRIPLTQEQGVIHAATTSALDYWLGENPDAAGALLEALHRALPPVFSELASGDVPLPIPGLEGWIENEANKRQMYGTPIESERLRSRPPSERRYASTEPVYDLTSRWIRNIPLLNSEMSPLQLKNLTQSLLSSYEGIAAAMASKGGEALGLIKPSQGDTKLDFDPGVVDPFTVIFPGRSAVDVWDAIKSGSSEHVAIRPPYRTESEDLFFEMRGKLTQVVSSWNRAKEANDVSAMTRIWNENRQWMQPQLMAKFNEVNADMTEMAQREELVRKAYQNGALRKDELGDLLDELRGLRQLKLRELMFVLRERFKIYGKVLEEAGEM